MPKRDDVVIEMSDLGLLKAVNTPDYKGNARRGEGLYEMVFDTGVIVYAPEPIFHVMQFSLPEKD